MGEEKFHTTRLIKQREIHGNVKEHYAEQLINGTSAAIA